MQRIKTTAPSPDLTERQKTIAADILHRLTYKSGKAPAAAQAHDWLGATVLTVRDRIVDRWIASGEAARQSGAKQVYYLSLEFLIGRLLRDAVTNLELQEDFSAALGSLGVDLDLIAALEPDAALGNGGLGRLAACFMEAMASVDIAACGYGIRYHHGLFRQEMADGWQIELPEEWLVHGNPWEFERREASYEIGFGGTVMPDGFTPSGVARYRWKPAERMIATAFDTPIVGWQAKRVNTLRLWEANPVDPILLDKFNAGDHVGALEERNKAEAVTRVLYPADSHLAGQELRLRQEYFFSAASLSDILRQHLATNPGVENLADKVAIQLNDTHPAIAVIELLRLLIDEHGLDFKDAWKITGTTFSYTNHTLLPEALESWPITLLERMLPRHMQLIFAVNAHVLRGAVEQGFDDGAVARLSIIDENGERRVRMGNIAFMGSKSVNGVSALHTELMKETVFADLHALFPGRINNKTNGITPRRWLMQSNPQLHALATEVAGPLMEDATRLLGLEKFARDSAFQNRFQAIKRQNKEALARLVEKRTGIRIDPSALFDIQIKRIHEYKRQLLNIIETVALYDEMRAHPERQWVPRVKLFAGKAAPSYHNAKLIVKLANDVAKVVNDDPSVSGLLKVVFMPNYNVSMAEVIVPAADLSEQISTAGMEASGTGNMKFALNGALTIGTLDGANVEMREHVGAGNILIFGLTAEDVAARRRAGRDPTATIDALPALAQALKAIASGTFSPDDPARYAGLIDGLKSHDWFFVTDDFADYARAQRDVDQLWKSPQKWTEKAILNTARMGWFSADRTIRDYAKDIWQVSTR